MDLNEILHVATFAGKIMLESGGETYRAEEIIWRICKIYGVEEAESFVTTTGIMVSIYSNGKTYSLIRRVSARTIDLDKVDKVNDLSRNIVTRNLSVSQLKEQLHIINNVERYNDKTTIIISAFSAFSFVFLFGGNFPEAIAAFFIGLIIKSLSIKFSTLEINDFFINSICGGIVAILAIFFLKIGFINDMDKTIIGSIMLLVPGLAITNAIRDTISGDLLAGSTRAVEAFLIAISIAIGTGAVLSFWISTFGGL
ncbi:threonine/serine exporter family protein [Clostridium sp. AL.422]|uniref:threonine/serine exporter family protein n=1 Tax=Clostridium TaxID=1485 RepID=UPI00293DC192|nr:MULTISPECIES: threonine/serine exporter family protein [unclassified Clostridium]MDV4152423.1 threonine/serine exporter family protein [Clostridium sp. AL.422]